MLISTVPKLCAVSLKIDVDKGVFARYDNVTVKIHFHGFWMACILFEDMRLIFMQETKHPAPIRATLSHSFAKGCLQCSQLLHKLKLPLWLFLPSDLRLERGNLLFDPLSAPLRHDALPEGRCACIPKCLARNPADEVLIDSIHRQPLKANPRLSHEIEMGSIKLSSLL